MKGAVKKEILYDLTKTIDILQVKESKDYDELRKLSNHAVEDVALQKDMDLVSVTVLIYSLYKIVQRLKEDDYKKIVSGLISARESLKSGNLGKYNSKIKGLFKIVKNSDAKVKEHLQNVMQAARIKKGTILLEKGLSIGQAAGLMGLSNWDLQEYASKRVLFDAKHEAVSAKQRVLNAFKIFGV